MNKDYKTIKEPVLEEGVVKTHLSIQQIISQIETIRFNYIVNLEAVIAYKKLIGLDATSLENDVKELEQRIKHLEKLKNGKRK